jgi:hypothetical protein
MKWGSHTLGTFSQRVFHWDLLDFFTSMLFILLDKLYFELNDFTRANVCDVYIHTYMYVCVQKKTKKVFEKGRSVHFKHGNLRTRGRMHLCMQDDQIGTKLVVLALADMLDYPISYLQKYVANNLPT